MKVKHDIYQEVTNRMLDMMADGDLGKWTASWNRTTSRGLPVKHDMKPYRGVNVIMLWSAQQELGYTSNVWMTYRQAESYGGNVKKGEKSQARSILFKPFEKGVKQDDGTDKVSKFLMIRDYAVFNCDQIENLPARFYATNVPLTEFVNGDERIDHADEFFGNLGMDLHHGGDRAFYRPSTDEVHMPEFSEFKSSRDYYATLAHESTHWTGGDKRLKRIRNTARFGDEAYAFEELIAEIGAAFTMATLGLSPTDEPRKDHVQYLKTWIKVLKNDKKAIFTAASAASNAIDFMLKQQPAEAVEDEPVEAPAPVEVPTPVPTPKPVTPVVDTPWPWVLPGAKHPIAA